MEDRSNERAAVVRAWTEPGPPRRLKIRVLTADEGATPARVIGVTTDIDQACALIRGWLTEVASGDQPRS